MKQAVQSQSGILLMQGDQMPGKPLILEFSGADVPMLFRFLIFFCLFSGKEQTVGRWQNEIAPEFSLILCLRIRDIVSEIYLHAALTNL